MMSAITLEVPTLVKEVQIVNKKYFYIRPLFSTALFAASIKYDVCLTQYKKELQNHVKYLELSKNNQVSLLWLLFRPKMVHRLVHVDFKLGIQPIKGVIGVIFFEIHGNKVAYLPSLNNYMFFIQGNTATELEVEVQDNVRLFLRNLKNEQAKSSKEELFDATQYLSTRKEFISLVSVKLQLTYDKYAFEAQDISSFFSSFSASINFVGEVEIEKVGYCLNERYPSGLKRAYLREQEINQLYHLWIEPKQINGLVLVGEAGVGRHTLLEECVMRYLENTADNILQEKQQFWHINPNRVIAGMSVVGYWQKRFEAILNFFKSPYPDAKYPHSIIIDNPVALLKIGKSAQNNMTLSDLLKPYIENRSVQVTLIATPDEWKIIQEKNRRFADLFQVFRLQAPDAPTATKMVLHQRRELENLNDCQFTIQSIILLFNIHRIYFKNHALPGGVMKLMTQLAVKYKGSVIDLPEVRAEFKASSGLQEYVSENGQSLKENEVEDQIGMRLVGQPSAVGSLANAFQLIKAKLTDPTKPFSSYLFIGPTGVGKTQAAKVLCHYLMGDETHLIRLDMNEYIDDYAVQRLIGDESNPEGVLISKVRYHTFGVILLDEIEKANPAVRDLLLQVLDDARLTDSLGKEVSFSNFVIIMTSNVGATEINNTLGLGSNLNERDIYQKAVEKYFRPEFINRIDEIVIFNPLNPAHTLEIARLQIRDLLQRDGFVRRTTILNVTQDTLHWIADRGYDQKMGGRALKRQIEKELTALSAEKLIALENDQPIIFDINFDKALQKIVPKIYPLHLKFQDAGQYWFPNVPKTLDNEYRYYDQLLRQIEIVEAKLNSYRKKLIGDLTTNWRFFQLTNISTELKEQITDTKLLVGEVTVPHNSLLSFKKITIENDKLNTILAGDLLFEIREHFKYGEYMFSKTQCKWANYFIDVVLLEIYLNNFIHHPIDRVTLSFRSFLEGYGDRQIAYLMEQYTNLLKELNATFESLPNEKIIRAEGNALSILLAREVGLHLFYINNQTPIPISLELLNTSTVEQSMEVIRIYDDLDTLTDLRNCYIIHAKMNAKEHKTLLLSSFKKREMQALLE